MKRRKQPIQNKELWALGLSIPYAIAHMLFNLSFAVFLLAMIGSLLVMTDLISNIMLGLTITMCVSALTAAGLAVIITKLGGEVPKLPMLFDKI